jgi:hypothetical protein
MRNIKLHYCDLYRDGGSIGLSFSAQGGQGYSFSELKEGLSEPYLAVITMSNWLLRRRQYELLLQVKHSENPSTRNYNPPVIYLENCNSGTIVKTLNWQQAQEFASLFPDMNVEAEGYSHFEHLLAVIQAEGISST